MGMAAGPQKGPKAEINVTPLVDVVLVLLIIFMVITPMLQRGKSVTLPRAMKIEGEGDGKDATDPIIISMTADKKIWIETDNYDEQGFKTELQKKLIADPGKPLLLKGDQSLTFDDVRTVMELARKAGAKGIGLGVEEVKDDDKDKEQ